MSKSDRSKTSEVYVCGFVPNYLLPNKASWYLDPFLHPLITEIEDSLILLMVKYKQLDSVTKLYHRYKC